jgi:predicted outer membrane repeat protein
MLIEEGSPALTNVTFSGNTASYGSGMYNYDHSNPVLTNVTFTGNTAGTHGGGMYNSTSSPTLVNAILWNNTPNQIINESSASTPAVTYSDIQGGYTGQGNINLNPNLGSLANNGGSTQTHALTAGSPAIDSGSPITCPPTDQRRFPRPVDGNNDGQAWCDMGAYEYGSQLLWMNLPLVIR